MIPYRPEQQRSSSVYRGREEEDMFNIRKGVVGGSGTGLKDLPYNIGDPYTSKVPPFSLFRITLFL